MTYSAPDNVGSMTGIGNFIKTKIFPQNERRSHVDIIKADPTNRFTESTHVEDDNTIDDYHPTASKSQCVRPHVREAIQRIFVNRSLHMEKIKFFGFDMDYTLAVYKSPEFESLSFDLIKARLVNTGYPKEIMNYKYDASFPVRRLYPNKFVEIGESRIYILNTLFHLPQMYMLSCLVHYFNTNKEYTLSDKGITKGNIYMSYWGIYENVKVATNWIHDADGPLKRETVNNLSKYVSVNPKLPILLNRLKSTGAKIFLLTNSGFAFTQSIMTYILNIPDGTGKIRPWTSYFDYIVVDADKPRFFKQGSRLRCVDTQEGQVSFGYHEGPLEKGRIYSEGSCEIFSQLIGARGKDVLYVGDHIFGDIIKSKKTVGWRTYLVIPELNSEISVWTAGEKLFERLQQLNISLADGYRNLNISSELKPDLRRVKEDIRNVASQMERAYGSVLGSVFRNGSRHTFFSSQVLRYSDVYSSSCLNLMHYPLFYMFRSESTLMPHETNLTFNDTSFFEDGPTIRGSLVIPQEADDDLSEGLVEARQIFVDSDYDPNDNETPKGAEENKDELSQNSREDSISNTSKELLTQLKRHPI